MKRLQKFATDHSNVKIHGFVSDIPQLLRRMSVAISFSPREGFPNNLLQAMATGIPVIALENGATRELVPSEQIGYLFQTLDDALLKLKRLLENRRLARQIGEYASRHVGSHYSIQAMVDPTFKLYKEMVS